MISSLKGCTYIMTRIQKSGHIVIEKFAWPYDSCLYDQVHSMLHVVSKLKHRFTYITGKEEI
jgi:hypothetical protein